MSLFGELHRRNVVRVGAAYVVIGWILAQVAEFAFENFGAPEWALKSFVALLLLGLPLALFFAWAFELTPDGIKREQDVDRSRSITPVTGRKLDRAIIGALVLVGTVMNILAIPHPTWFAVSAIVGIVATVLATGRLAPLLITVRHK